MEMFLMAICMSVLAFGVTAAAFGAATRDSSTASEPESNPKPQPRPTVAAARFFSDGVPGPRPFSIYASVPTSTLLLEIENHVRLEHAAAESFLEAPTSALLHSKTISPLIQ